MIASITQPITTVVAHATAKAEAALTAASRNVYWLAKEEIATYKYSSLNYLTKLQGCAPMQGLGVAKNAQYTSYHIAEEMQEAITCCIKEDIVSLIIAYLLVCFLMKVLMYHPVRT